MDTCAYIHRANWRSVLRLTHGRCGLNVSDHSKGRDQPNEVAAASPAIGGAVIPFGTKTKMGRRSP